MKLQENNKNFLNTIKNKINVFFNEYNLLMGSGGVTYLPFVSGILSANAKKIHEVKNNFKFHKFIFHPDIPENHRPRCAGLNEHFPVLAYRHEIDRLRNG